MTTKKPNRQPTRRAILAGIPAAVAAGAMLPTVAKAATVATGDDRELFGLLAEWRKEVAAYEDICDQWDALDQQMPKDARHPWVTIEHDGKEKSLHVDFMIVRHFEPDMTIWDRKHPGRETANPYRRRCNYLKAELERRSRLHNEWYDRLGLYQLDEAAEPIMERKSDLEMDIMLTPAQTSEGLTAKLEIYRDWLEGDSTFAERWSPTLFDEIERLIAS